MESAIFEKLGFNTVTASFYDKIMLQLYTYSIQESKKSIYLDHAESSSFRDETKLAEISSYCSYIAKFACYNYELLTCFSKQVIADAVIGTALEVLEISAPGILAG